MSDAWFYGGIRSIGRYVCVLDELGQPRVCQKVTTSRRKLRQALRREYSDAIIIVPLNYPRRKLSSILAERSFQSDTTSPT